MRKKPSYSSIVLFSPPFSLLSSLFLLLFSLFSLFFFLSPLFQHFIKSSTSTQKMPNDDRSHNNQPQ